MRTISTIFIVYTLQALFVEAVNVNVGPTRRYHARSINVPSTLQERGGLTGLREVVPVLVKKEALEDFYKRQTGTCDPTDTVWYVSFFSLFTVVVDQLAHFYICLVAMAVVPLGMTATSLGVRQAAAQPDRRVQVSIFIFCFFAAFAS
jgi:hypothetical protein